MVLYHVDVAGPARVLRVLMIAAAAMTLIFSSLQAQAQTLAYEEPTEVRVGYADLDLSQPADVARLYARLKLAAKRACDSHPNDLRNLRVQHLQRQCYERSLRMAVEQVEHASIKALYVANTVSASHRR